MNREFKARAWDGEKWRYDFLIKSNGELITQDKPATRLQEATYKRVKWELSEFTGMYDSCGEEIYEGDLIQSINLSDPANPVHHPPREVKWSERGCNYNVHNPRHDERLIVVGHRYE